MTKKEYDTPPLPGGVWMTGVLESAVLEDNPKAADGKLKAVFAELVEDGQGKPHKLRLFTNWFLGFKHDDPDTEKLVNEINGEQLTALFAALGAPGTPPTDLPQFVGEAVRVRVGRWKKRGVYWVPQGLRFQAVEDKDDASIPF